MHHSDGGPKGWRRLPIAVALQTGNSMNLNNTNVILRGWERGGGGATGFGPPKQKVSVYDTDLVFKGVGLKSRVEGRGRS